MKLVPPFGVAFALLLSAGLAAAAPPEKPADKVFVGYLYGSPRDLDLKLYTHLCHAFLVADGDGNVRPSRGIPNLELTSKAHEAGVKVLLSLGGWGWDEQFAELTSKPEAESRYVEAVMKLVDEGDYDGIDLDWEYPDTKDEIVGFERLTRTFRKQLDELGVKKGRPMLVTMAASSNPGTLRWLQKDFLLETMDWVNVMTYDFAGDWTDYAGHNAPLFASSKVRGGPRSTADAMRFMTEEQGVPADRLAVGIPLYGRGFAVSEPYASTKGAPKGRIPDGGYREIQQLLDKGGWKRVWDDETKTPWVIADDGKAVIGYDDAESVALKAEWAMQQGFRGVFFWQVAQDRMPDGSHPLQEAARKALDAAARPAR